MESNQPSEEMREYLAIERALRAGRLDDLPSSITDEPGYPNVPDRYTWTPLVILAISWAPPWCVRDLVENGADVNVAVDDGFPAVLGAVMSGREDRIELVGALIDVGADVETPGVNGWTPLHAAAAANDTGMVTLLLQHGADPNARTGVDDDLTPLQEAQRAGASDTVRLLEEVAHDGHH